MNEKKYHVAQGDTRVRKRVYCEFPTRVSARRQRRIILRTYRAPLRFAGIA